MMGEETFHPDTRALLAYGRALAGAAAPPKKGGADHVLERLFVLERTADGRLPIRTFGADLIKLFGRDLREHNLAHLFLPPDLVLLNALLEATTAAGEPGVARLTGETNEGGKLGVEMLLTPLRIDGSPSNRLLGMFQPLGGERFLNGQSLRLLRLGSLHPPTAKTPKSMRLVVINS